MATNRPATIQCARCKREKVKENALTEGWIIVQRAAGSPGDLHILCDLCRNRPKAAPIATLDVQEVAPFSLAERQAQRNRAKSSTKEPRPSRARPQRGKNASH